MSSDPLVSVVVPTYNAPALLRETLDTVFAQTLADFEVVVVDDGSTDDTPDVLRSLDDPRLRIVRQANAGIGAARNRGIDAARGRYVALLDHDDLWKPDKLAVQVEFMQRHPACAACAVPFAYSTAPEQFAVDPAAVRDADGVVRRPLRQLAHGRVFLISSAILFDRERAAGLRYETRPRCIEDTPFQIGLFARGGFGIAGDAVLMVYRFHAANYSSQSDFFYNGIRLLRERDAAGLFDDLSPGDRRDLRAFLAHTGRTAAVRQLAAGRRGRGLRAYLRELPHQLRDGRLRFLAGFPVMAAGPRRWAGTG